ncbi:MAG: HDOD domain-containing protein [Solidesulfovibrio sp.]|uniref:HDOD domain-containing protein n=1 Tax=Solidesulfovibrio sp. TaxID=2910990 RepID=UPI002B200FCF|nr:HDOD domain-containing protein [Solidesulfovibrio sp.]MEA4855555.1 HDOD domain-containing protein [Solidesulfovibrio sp.]
MVKVSIEEVKNGMVAGKDVSGQHGVLLLPKGSVISEEHLRAMRAFGVRDVEVVAQGPADGDDDEGFAEVLARCRALLRPRFAALDLAAPFGQMVFERAAARAAAQALAEGLDLDAAADTPSLTGFAPERQLFGPENIDPASLVSGEVELATLPEVHVRLLEALQAEHSSAQDLAAIIGRDPSLSAKLLRLVNSPHYGSRAPIDSIARAVAMVGRKELTTLVLGLAALTAFDDIEPGLWDMRAFWRHAAACAVYASLLAAACPGTAPDRAFVGGLLHDIGQLVILRKLPAAAARALLLSRVEGLPDAEAETAVLGFDHALVGRTLLTSWHFPETLTRIAADHHHPPGDVASRETALVHVADILATAWAWPAFSGSPVPALSEAAWRSLGLPETLLAEVAAAGDDRVCDIEAVFFSRGQTTPQ